jgi:hypothetical protein
MKSLGKSPTWYLTIKQFDRRSTLMNELTREGRLPDTFQCFWKKLLFVDIAFRPPSGSHISALSIIFVSSQIQSCSAIPSSARIPIQVNPVSRF